MSHFDSPRNQGDLADADVVSEGTNPVCLDHLRLYVKLTADRARVEAASFQAQGCVPAIAAGSVLTELLVGKETADLGRVDAAAIEQALGGLPATKKHAAHLAGEILAEALVKLRQK